MTLRKASRSLSAALLLSLWSGAASALVTEPNGLIVPRDSANGETQLYTLFSMRSETGLDWRNDAAQTPATFSPLCDFRATLVLKQTASNVGVAWYNVTSRTTAPTAAELFTIVPPGSPVGTMVTGANIRSSPNYLGGEIGFALVRTGSGFDGRPYTTQAALNPQCTLCSPAAPWIMAVIYPSRSTPNAFYVAFEDGNVGTSPSSYGNDGDYNDYVFFFEGLQCSGGGMACDTGRMGVCAAGLTGCNGMGCNQLTQPSMERCDGLDNDCNGMTDEGAALCPTDQLCSQGHCVPRCLEGSCLDGESCVNGLCIASDCVGVTCAAGTVCVGRACVSPCDGVTCPGTQVCRVGACVDPCAGVTCPSGQACDRGVCRTSCMCSPCATGSACNTRSGACVESACAAVDCSSMPGTVCRAGACVDACMGATCPRGQVCQRGACVAAPMPEPGPEPALLDASTDTSRAPDAATQADGGNDASNGDARMDAARDAGSGSAQAMGGCGCRTAGPTRSSAGLGVSAAALLAALRRRRRRSA